MSTRRSTRATSRAASSRAASPTPSAAPAPRRPARRAGNEALPSVSLRASNAYGRNDVPLMTGRVAHVPGQLNAVLAGLLPKDDDTTSVATSKGGRGGKRSHGLAQLDKSFGVEDSIFRGAGIDTSSLGSNNDDAPDEPLIDTPQQTHQPHLPQQRQQRQEPQQPKARRFSQPQQPPTQRSQQPPAPRSQQSHPQRAQQPQAAQEPWSWPAVPDWAIDFIDWLRDSFRNLRNSVYYLLEGLYNGLGMLMNWYTLAFLLLLLLAIFGKVQWPTDASDNDISGETHTPHTPHSPHTTHPFERSAWAWPSIKWEKPDWHPINRIGKAFSPDLVKGIEARLKQLEVDVAYLLKQNKIDHESIAHLEEILPNQVVVMKAADGSLYLPKNLWNAIKEAIENDSTLISESIDPKTGKPSKSNGVSNRDLKKALEQWMNENKGKLNSWLDPAVQEKFPDMMKTNDVVSKTKVIDLIEKSLEENHKAVKAELEQVAKAVKEQQRQLNKSPGLSKHAEKQLKDSIEKQVSAAVLSAISKVQINGAVNLALTSINHWSHGTGATILPHFTSKNHLFPSMNKIWTQKLYRWAISNPVKIPNPPEAALVKWEEHGDCWCSDAEGNDGYGASIGVLSGSSIYPEDVIVEHIAPSASLQPGAAPKEMELWAYVDGFETYDAIKEQSELMFPGGSRQIQQAIGFVQIAAWEYNLEAETSTQAFPVGLDLKPFGAHTNRLIVRAKNNWGGGKVDYTCFYRLRVHGEIAITPGP